MINQLSSADNSIIIDRGLLICCENFKERFKQLTKDDVEFVSNKLQRRNIVETHSRILKGDYKPPFKK